MVELNMTREEHSAYFSQVFKASSTDGRWNFSFSLSENQIDELKDKIKAKLDSRAYVDVKASYNFIEREIYSKMNIKPSKVEDFNASGLEETKEVIVAIRDKLVYIMQIKDYKPEQQTMEESMRN